MVDRSGKFRDDTVARGSDAHHGLASLYLDNLLIAGYRFADLRCKTNDGSLGNRLSELRHDDRDFRHIKWNVSGVSVNEELPL